MDNYDSGNSGFSLDLENRKLARSASRNSEDNEARIEKLATALEEMSIINEGLWSLISENLNINKDTLETTLETVKAARATVKVKKNECTNCKMSIPVTKSKCIYCGENLSFLTENNIFDPKIS